MVFKERQRARNHHLQLLLLAASPTLAFRLPCWTAGGPSREACCPAHPICFDGLIFTPQECCGQGQGWATVFPSGEATAKRSSPFAEQSAAMVTKLSGKLHPSWRADQSRWEAEHAAASIQRRFVVDGLELVIHEFKDNSQFHTNYAAVERSGVSPYGLQQPLEVAQGAVALDIGANLGLISILLARRFKHLKVVALEPHPALYRYLLWNLRENNVTDAVTPMRLGGCDPGQGSFQVMWPWWDPVRVNLIRPALTEDALRRLRDRLRVRCISLGRLLASLKWPQVAFMKVDCEGCEWGFLSAEGGGGLFLRQLREGKIKRVVGELHKTGFLKRATTTPVLRALCCEGESSKPFMEHCTEFVRCGASSKDSVTLRSFSSSFSHAKLKQAVKQLQRTQLVSTTLRACRAAEHWRPGTWPVQKALSWALALSSKLDIQQWNMKGLRFAKRRMLARVSGALLSRVVHLCSGGVDCVSSIASRGFEQLRRASAHDKAEAFFKRSQQGIAGVRLPWVHSWQTPTNFVRGLASRPAWTLADLREHGESAAAEIVEALEAAFPRILEDLHRVRRRPRWPAAYGPELIKVPRNWSKVLLYDGDLGGPPPPGLPAAQGYEPRKLHQGLCEVYAPNTCEILGKLLPGLRHPDLPYMQVDQEQVAFFKLAPGSRIHFHQASVNARLTLHLCLHGCGGSSRIQVGPKFLRWTRGRVIAFDDSFEHRVRIDPAKERWILHVMTTHPGVDTPQKMHAALREGRLWPR